MNCKKCGSFSLIEKSHEVQKVGVYCCDCDSWVKWGTIKDKVLIPEGIHCAVILAAEEKIKNDGDKYIVLTLGFYQQKNIIHFLWKNKETKKYDKKQLMEILLTIGLDINLFKNIESILCALCNKSIIVTVKHVTVKDKIIEKIVKIGEYDGQ